MKISKRGSLDEALEELLTATSETTRCFPHASEVRALKEVVLTEIAGDLNRNSSSERMPWFKSDRDRVRHEEKVRSKFLTVPKGATGLSETKDGRLVARGQIEIKDRRFDIVLVFPDDYPETPPRAFLDANNGEFIEPIETDIGETWTCYDDCGLVLDLVIAKLAAGQKGSKK